MSTSKRSKNASNASQSIQKLLDDAKREAREGPQLKLLLEQVDALMTEVETLEGKLAAKEVPPAQVPAASNALETGMKAVTSLIPLVGPLIAGLI